MPHPMVSHRVKGIQPCTFNWIPTSWCSLVLKWLPVTKKTVTHTVQIAIAIIIIPEQSCSRFVIVNVTPSSLIQLITFKFFLLIHVARGNRLQLHLSGSI